MRLLPLSVDFGPLLLRKEVVLRSSAVVFRGSHLVLCVIVTRLLPVVHKEFDGVRVAEFWNIRLRKDGEVGVAE